MPSEYANDLMARVGLDTTEWKKGITDLNAGIKHIETGFQATAALMDDWSNSSEGLKKRVESLNDKLALQKQVLELLKKAYEEEVEKSGASSRAAEELAKKMYKAKSDIDYTKASIEKYSQAEDEATKKTKAFIDELKQSGNKIANFGDKISSAGNALTVGVTAPVIAAGTAIYKYSSDLTEAENKTEATFGYMTDSIKEWAQNSLDSMGMARSTAYDSVALFGDMATSMDLPKSKAAEMSMSLVELMADLSSFKNVSLEQSQNALKGIFTGETESLKNLGIVMTETQLKSYAMSQGFEKNYEDMSQAEKVQLRYQYVLESSQNAIGDYSRTSGEAAGQMRKLPEALKELAASFEEHVEPVVTPLITALNNAIVSFGKWDDGSKKLAVLIAAVAAAVGPLVTVTGKAVTIAGKAKIAYAAFRNWLLKKTQATVADTAAEEKHAAALVKTSSAAGKASSGISGIGAAAAGALPYIAIVAAALGAFSTLASARISKATEAVEEHYDKLISDSDAYYDAETNKLNKQMRKVEESYSKQLSEVEEYYDKQIDMLEDNLKTQKKAIEKEEKLLQKAHKERMSQLEEERDLKLEVINTRENSQTSALQEKIDEIDALTEAEEKAEEERENRLKLAELQEAINSAKTYAEKVEAEKEYAEFVLELEREKVLKDRELKKQELQNQIELIQQESELERGKVNAEYEAARKSEEEKYNLEKEYLDLRLEALDTYIADETKRLSTAKEGRLKELQNELTLEVEAIKTALEEITKAKEEARKKLEGEKETKKSNATKEEWNKIWSDISTALLGLNSGGWLGANADGTDFWRGGLTRINEEGGEILNLPRGTQIIPHDVSMEMARAAGRQSAITNNSSTTNNSYHYGAQQQVTVFKLGDKTVARAIEPAVSVRMSDNIYGRRRSGVGAKRI